MLLVHDLELNVTEDAIEWLTIRGFDPQSGARPVKRLIQKEIINELSKEIIAGNIMKDSEVTVRVQGDKLVFNK